MSIFGKLLKTTFDLATLPVDMIKDVATGCGSSTDTEESYTWSKLQKLGEDGKEIRDEIDQL